MVEIMGWADRSRSNDLTLGRTMSQRNAERRAKAGFRVAAEVRVPGCTRASVTIEPGLRCVRVGFLDWPDGVAGRAQMHFFEKGSEGFALGRISLSRGTGPDEKWCQAIFFPFEGENAAVLDVVADQARYTHSLSGSAVHDDVAAMRFKMPGFGVLADFVRPDLVGRCMLPPCTFDPDLTFGLDEPFTDWSPAAPSL